MTDLRPAFAALILLAGTVPVLALDRVPIPDPIRPCPRYGAGFVQMPGSATCVRIGGRVTAEAGTATRRIARDQIAGFGSSGRVSVDSRTPTDYGDLRAYVRMRAGTGSVQGR